MTEKEKSFAEIVKRKSQCMNIGPLILITPIIGACYLAKLQEKSWQPFFVRIITAYVSTAASIRLTEAVGLVPGLNLRKDTERFSRYFNRVVHNEELNPKESAELAKGLFTLLLTELEAYQDSGGDLYHWFPAEIVDQFKVSLPFLPEKVKHGLLWSSKDLAEVIPLNLRQEIISGLRGDASTWPWQFASVVRDGLEQAQAGKKSFER